MAERNLVMRRIGLSMVAAGALIGAGVAAKGYMDYRTNATRVAADRMNADTAAAAAAEAKREWTGRISRMATELKRCRAKEKMPEGCLDAGEKAVLRKNAEDYASIGEFRKAGLIYVRLGDRAKAMEMQGKCANGIPQAAAAPGFRAGTAPNEPVGKDSQGAIEIGTALIKQIENTVPEYNRCKPVPPAGCPDMNALAKSAEAYETSGDYRKAGLIYVELGNINKARAMIFLCRRGIMDGAKAKNQDPDGAAMIEEAMKARGEALEQSAR